MKQTKKYKVVAKVGNTQVASNGFAKYNVNNLLLFTDFLDKQFPNWRWFNVFTYTKEGDGDQLDSFTNKKRPTKSYI